MNSQKPPIIPLRSLAVSLVAVAIASVAYAEPGDGANNAVTIRQLLNDGRLARDRGDWTAALAATEKAMRAASNSLPEDDSLGLRTRLLHAQARSLLALNSGQLDEALQWAERAARLGQPARPADPSPLPREDPDRIAALLTLADVYVGRHDLEAAMVLYRQTASLAAAQPRQRLQAGLMIARIGMHQGQWTLEKSAALLASVQRHLQAADPLYREAQERLIVHHAWGDLLGRAKKVAEPGGETADAAEAQLRAGLNAFQQTLHTAGVKPAVAAMAGLALAQFQWDQRRLAAVDATLAELAPMIDEDWVSPLFQLLYWNQLGLIQSEWHHFASAREHHERARAIAERMQLREQLVAIDNNLGQLALRQGDYAAAKSRLREAVTLYESDPALAEHPGRPYAMSNLAKALEGEKDYVAARQMFRDALVRIRQTATKDRYAECLCLAGLGVNLYSVGQFEQAEEELLAARRLAVEALGPAHLHVAELDVNLGWTAITRQRLEEAERRFRAALQAVQVEYGDEHPRTAEVMAYLGRVLTTRDQRQEASQLLAESLALREQYLRRTMHTSLSERDRLSFVQNLRVHSESTDWPGALDTFLDLAPRLNVPIEDQYRRVLAWKGVVARHALPRVEQLEDDPGIQALARRREDLLEELRKAYFTNVPLARRREHTAGLQELERQVNGLEQRLRGQSGRFAQAESAPTETVLTELAASLPAGSALLDVIELRRYKPRAASEPVGENNFYVGFLMRPDQPLVRIDFGPATAVDNAVRNLLEAVDRADPDYRQPAEQLATLIRRPLIGKLQGVERLIAAGDGWFHRLPLGALPGETPGTYWIEELSFASVSTAHSLIGRRPQRRSDNSAAGLLAVGGVDYGDPSASRWPPLPATRAEAEEVSRLFRQTHGEQPVDMLTDKRASKPAVRKLLSQHRYIHLATHGAFDARYAGQGFDVVPLVAQLDSGLVLAQGDGGEGRYGEFLTAEEVSRLDMREAELVVLSACQTGLGHLRSGQGLIGLLGALDRAGARTVISSLWRVDDEATFLLMRGFYEQLWSEKRHPAEALREAQLQLLRGTTRAESRRAFTHPKYWAAFIVSGAPDQGR